MEITSIPKDLFQRTQKTDWLIDPSPFVTGLFSGDASDEIVLTNGLISRTWRLVPNGATVGFGNLVTGEPIIRSIRPEARVTLDGTEYPVGGLRGLDEHAYLRREWIDELDAILGAFRLECYESGPTVAPFPWKRVRHAPDIPWPPPGVRVSFQYAAPEGDHLGVQIVVHYELYDGIPLLAKWIELSNGTGNAIRLNSFASEILAAVEYESERHERSEWTVPNLHVESDYGLFDMSASQPRATTHWVPDPEYTTQVNYEYRNPCLLESRPPRGPNLTIPPGERFTSFRTFELAYDSTERERRDLALPLQRMGARILPFTVRTL